MHIILLLVRNLHTHTYKYTHKHMRFSMCARIDIIIPIYANIDTYVDIYFICM